MKKHESYSFSRSQRIDILKTAWGHMKEELYRREGLENKATLSVCSLLLLVPGFLMKEDVVLSVAATKLFFAACISVTILAIYFLITNARRIRWTCRAIVRIQDSLGLFLPDALAHSEAIQNLDDSTLEEASVLPSDGREWGNGGWMLGLWPHLLSLLLCCAASCSALIWAVQH